MLKIIAFIESHLIRPMEKITNQKYFAAIRQGFLSISPLSLIGSLFLVITILPFPETWALKQFITRNEAFLLAPYRMTALLITPYLVVSIGARLAKTYSFRQTSGSMIALVTFFMTIVPVNPSEMVPSAFIQAAVEQGLDMTWFKTVQDLGWVLPLFPLGGAGVYVGVFSAILGVEILRLYEHTHRLIKAKSNTKKNYLPKSILQTMDTLIPITFVVISSFLLRSILKLDVQGLILRLFQSLVRSTNTFWGSIFFVVLMSLMSFFQLDMFHVSHSAASLVWVYLISANRLAYSSGTSLPFVTPFPFYQVFIWIGGAGTTLSLVLLLCFSKNKYLKQLGITCFVPSLFNINSPVMYGVPVMLNPYFIIPFILAPFSATLISYACISTGLVGGIYNAPPSTLPAPIGAFLATGDWRAVLLSIFNLILCALIYYPFVKVFEDKLLAEETVEQEAKEAKDKAAALSP